MRVPPTTRFEICTLVPKSKSMTFAAQIITLYPDMFPGPLGHSLAGRAREEGRWSLDTIQLRDFATDKHRTVDDTPAGGGAGMVLKCDVLAAAVDAADARMRAMLGNADAGGGVSTSLDTNEGGEGGSGSNTPILAMTPRGRPITQQRVRELAGGAGVTILCGRFEGFDERLFEARPHIEQVSMGDIILSGGEMGALMLMDAIIRLLPGVMGSDMSGEEESFESGLLEYPHYTRPAAWEGLTIPDVLRSGDHAKIERWRREQAEADTKARRPDLWQRHRAKQAET